MTLTSIGDLSQSLMMRSRASDIKTRIATLTQELSTGRTADINGRLGGDFSLLADMDRNLARLESHALANTETRVFAGAMQAALTQVQDLVGNLGADILSVGAHASPSVLDGFSTRAAADLNGAVAALNGSNAGRSLFAGVSTGTAPIAGAAALMDALRSELTGLSTSHEILTAADAWFDDPAGFRSAIYTGSDTDLAPFQVGPGRDVDLSIRADDPALKGALRDLAVAALASDPDLDLSASARSGLFDALGSRFLASQDSLVSVRADLGQAEARLEEAGIRNEASRFALSEARNTLLAADPYDTATLLEEAQSQLEMLYAVTVRSSRLTLASFMS